MPDDGRRRRHRPPAASSPLPARGSRDDTDRRAQRVVLTDAGRAALEDHVADGNRWLADAIAGTLTPAERRVLDVAADLLVTVAGHGDPPGSRRAHWGS